MKNGWVKGMKVIKMELGSEYEIELDTVVMALGTSNPLIASTTKGLWKQNRRKMYRGRRRERTDIKSSSIRCRRRRRNRCSNRNPRHVARKEEQRNSRIPFNRLRRSIFTKCYVPNCISGCPKLKNALYHLGQLVE